MKIPGNNQVDQLRALLWLLEAGGGGGGGGGGATVTTADFVQPSTFVGSNTVVVDVKKTAGIFAGGFVAVENGGFYLVTAVVTDTSITLLNVGDSHNVGGGTTVPKGSVVSVQAFNVGDTLGGFSVSSTKPVINLADPQWLVTGDGSDEHGRIQLAINAAIAQNAILYAPPPDVAYGVGTPLNFAGVEMEGVTGKTLFAATGAIEAVALLAGGNKFTGIKFSGARLANRAAESIGDALSIYTDCEFSDGLIDGYSQPNQTAAVTFSAVTQTGPGPSIGVTAYEQYQLQVSFVTGVVVKINGGGGLETATFVVSFDNGVTYDTNTQTLFAVTQIALPSGASAFLTGSFIVLNADPGAYVIDTTYAFTPNEHLADNASVLLTRPIFQNNGIIYASAGLIGDYGGGAYNAVLAPGTVSTTAGSQLVIGVGTSFLSTHARDGDIIQIVGCFELDGSTPQGLMVTAVLSDTELVVDINCTPNNSVAGADYGIAVGAGAFQYTETGSQTGTVIDGPICKTCANGIRVGGLAGILITGSPQIFNPAGAAVVNGTPFAD